MAEAPKVVEQGLEKLVLEITCPVCQRLFRDPKVLPCWHYFCGSCIQQVAAKLPHGEPLPCPECKKTSTLPGNDAGKLPTAFFVNRLKELHVKMEKIERKVDACCEMCSGAKAESFCRQCAEFICSDCEKSHRKMKIKYPGHEVASLEELKRGGATAKPFPVPPKSAPPSKCPDHDEQLKLFCFDCSQLICRDCIVIEHAQHRYEFVKKSASQCRQALNDGLVPLKKINDSISEAVKEIEVTKSNISSQGAYVREHIERCFAQLFEILQRRKEKVLSEATEAVRRKMDALNDQEKNLELAASEIQNMVGFVEKNLLIVTDEELLSVHQQLLERMEEEREKHEKASLEPAEIPNLAVSITCVRDITKASEQKARVYLFPAQQRYEVYMAEIGKETTQFIMDTSDPNHKQLQPIKAEVKSVVDNSTVDAKVAKTGRGLYEVTYCPKIRGRHELHIEVNGKPINGSPFLVFVKIPPSQLSEPLRVIEGLRHPYAAAFDHQQQLLVTESGGQKIRALKTRGMELVMTDFIQHQVCNPTGLAVDWEGNIYVASVTSHSISKYSKHGKCLKVAGREGSDVGEFDHPSGIAVVGEEVFVCDRNNNRIQVFDKQLKFIRTFGSHGNCPGQLHWPYDLVYDQTGHVYIADCDNHRIQIFDTEGHFVHVFSDHGSDCGMVKRPMGLCLGNDQILYVTEYDNHRVSVFKTDGEFVTSFGKYGTKKGDLCYPVGVAVDRDGFVYVCDQGNSRIQVF